MLFFTLFCTFKCRTEASKPVTDASDEMDFDVDEHSSKPSLYAHQAKNINFKFKQ